MSTDIPPFIGSTLSAADREAIAEWCRAAPPNISAAVRVLLDATDPKLERVREAQITRLEDMIAAFEIEQSEKYDEIPKSIAKFIENLFGLCDSINTQFDAEAVRSRARLNKAAPALLEAVKLGMAAASATEPFQAMTLDQQFKVKAAEAIALTQPKQKEDNDASGIPNVQAE